MSLLRERMIGDMQLRGLWKRTMESPVGAVAALQDHFGQSPARLTEEDLRSYLLFLMNEKKAARGTHTIALYGIKFFSQQTLGREWNLLGVVRPPREKKLPVVRSRSEVWQILDCVSMPVYRACLTAINSCGLRLMEGATLSIPQVDSARKLLHIRGKGNKDRYVPIQDSALDMFREHWKTHRFQRWLFPAPTRRRHATPITSPSPALSGPS